jgi:hypothetical protein
MRFLEKDLEDIIWAHCNEKLMPDYLEAEEVSKLLEEISNE